MRTGVAMLLCAALLLTGCGFHLQGRAALPAVVKSPYLEAPDRQSDFVRSLRRTLTDNGAALVHESGQASAVISVLRDTFTRRVLSVSVNNQPNEYEITYTVSFSVSAAGQQVLAPQDLAVTRTYSFDERLLLAKGHEEEDLRADMAHDLADMVMRRLARLGSSAPAG